MDLGASRTARMVGATAAGARAGKPVVTKLALRRASRFESLNVNGIANSSRQQRPRPVRGRCGRAANQDLGAGATHDEDVEQWSGDREGPAADGGRRLQVGHGQLNGASSVRPAVDRRAEKGLDVTDLILVTRVQDGG